MIRVKLIASSLDAPLGDSPDLTIHSPTQYVTAYDRLARAVHAGEGLTVHIFDVTVGRWFEAMASKYGRDQIVLEKITARYLFEKQTGIGSLPSDITDRKLLDSRLLDVKIPALPGTSFEDHILEVFFGKTLTLPDGMGLRRVSEIVSAYEESQWREALSRPLVATVFQKRVRAIQNELKRQSRNADLQLLDWYVESPQLLFRNLFAVKLLQGYPDELGRRSIGAIYPEIIRLNLDLRSIPVNIAGNPRVVDEIRRYLASETAQPSGNVLEQLLERVSGLLELEFDHIAGLIRSGGQEVSKDIVSKIQAKFSPLQSSPRISQALADLDLLVERPEPSIPDVSWDADRWLRWAEEEYLPYRYWLESTGQLNNEIGELAGKYGDWLFKNYGSLLYHSDRMAWNALRNLRELESHEGPILVVIIDNFNTKFYPDLKSQMQLQGFYEQHMQICLSALPSCTEVSKKSLIVGHYSPFLEGNYQSQVEGTWSDRLGKKVKYLGTIGDFRNVAERAHDVYFLNYLAVDITLHLNENSTGISHAQTVRSHLALLAQDIKAFATRIGSERNLLTIFVSDHGSTRIPKDTTNVIDSRFYRERAQDEHHRYLSYGDPEKGKLPQTAQYECYLFDREKYELSANYLAARRLYRFRVTSDHAYVHGGLTPEETLVPLAIFSPVTISPKQIEVRLAENTRIRVGTKLDLSLEITNTNSYACEGITIEFVDPNINAGPVTISSLGPFVRETLVVPARCPRAADPSARRMNLRLGFRFLGQDWETDVKIPVIYDEVAKAKFDLDQL